MDALWIIYFFDYILSVQKKYEGEEMNVQTPMLIGKKLHRIWYGKIELISNIILKEAVDSLLLVQKVWNM